MAENLSKLEVPCDKCECKNTLFVSPVKDYDGATLRAYWCKECHVNQIIRYKFVEGVPIFTERLDPEVVYIEREVETGLTVRPKASKRHYQG